MIKELQTARRVICQRLRKRPYNKSKAAKMTAWTAVLEQLLDGRRYGAFSWHNAVETEVRGYIAELDEQTKRTIWNSSADSKVLPGASLETITECLYPIIFQATLPRIHRAVDYRRKTGEPEGGANDE
jgi:hypothetical protein